MGAMRLRKKQNLLHDETEAKSLHLPE